MPHVYTASWIDDTDDVCALACDTFDAWIELKCQAAYGLLQSKGHTTEAPGRRTFRAWLTETMRDGARQTTEVTAVHSRDPFEDSPSGWLTVDVHRCGDDTRDYLPSPWLVQQLIATGVRPRLADDRLAVSPTFLRGTDAGEELAARVSAFDRRIPTVVLSSVPDQFARLRTGRSNLADIASDTARSCAGLATVVLVDEDALDQFNAALGPDLAVPSGGLRVFRPDADPATPGDGRRHPCRRPEAWYTHPAAAPAFVGRLLTSDALTAARTAVTV